MLRDGANSVTPVQQAEVPESGARSWCTRITLEHHPRRSPDMVGPLLNKKGNWYLLIAMDNFSKWLEVYTIPNQKASTVMDALVADFFCHFRVPRQLHWSRLELHVSTPVRGVAAPGDKQVTCSDMAWWNTMWRWLRSTWTKPFWCTRQIKMTGYPPSCLPTEHQPMKWQSMMPTSIVFGRQVHLFCKLSPPGAVYNWLCDMKACYNCLANSMSLAWRPSPVVLPDLNQKKVI
jgi:hypothetical protein